MPNSAKLYIVILFSFILPWFIGIFLYFKDKQIIVTIAPFACMLGFILNTIGIDLGYFYPPQLGNIKPHTIAILPNIGLLAIISCAFIFAVCHTKIKPFILNLLFTVIATPIDMILIYYKFLEYNKGWNILLTSLAYIISFYIIYFYYLWIKKLRIVPNN